MIIKISYLFYFSPEWRPENAIWIGASDTKQEGRFAWTDKSPMDYKSKQQFKTFSWLSQGLSTRITLDGLLREKITIMIKI